MHPRKRIVDRYDGQTITVNGEESYDLGNYLGGGAAGNVHEAINLKPESGFSKQVAVKILNPVGFKLMNSAPLQRCLVVRKGVPMPLPAPIQPGSGIAPCAPPPMASENVWWCVHPVSRQVVAAQVDARSGQLRELPLGRCIEVWGWNPLREGVDHSQFASANGHGGRSLARQRSRGGGGVSGAGGSQSSTSSDEHSDSSSSCSIASDRKLEKHLLASGEQVYVEQLRDTVVLPRVPPKFVRWLRARQGIYREIANMAHLGRHPNVVGLQEVLEYVQDSKSTLFLVLDLVTGGELFDRIGPGRGTSEIVAQRYFRQLVHGVSFCHAKGVCHRDLKPENLLLADASGSAVLKIADFGLSAAFAIAASSSKGGSGGAGGGSSGGEGSHGDKKSSNSGSPERLPPPLPPPLDNLPPGSPISNTNTTTTPPTTPVLNMRRLRSVVGSPHYCAPEVSAGSLSLDESSMGGGGSSTTDSERGYDGPKADVWSCGVILYTLLAGTLPFNSELASCPRYSRFRDWALSHDIGCVGDSGTLRIAPLASSSLSSSPSSTSSPHSTNGDPSAFAVHHPRPIFGDAPPSSSPTLSPSPPPPPQEAQPHTDGVSFLPPSPPRSPPRVSTRGGANRNDDVAAACLAPLDSWFFPAHFPERARGLVAALLHPEAARRPRMEQIALNVWVESGHNPPSSSFAPRSGGSSAAASPNSREGTPPSPLSTRREAHYEPMRESDVVVAGAEAGVSTTTTGIAGLTGLGRHNQDALDVARALQLSYDDRSCS